METLCFIAAAGLVVCGLAVACAAARRRDSRRRRKAPPPMPPRVELGMTVQPVSRPRTRTAGGAARELPPRRTSASAAAGAARGTGANRGPRGIRPEQFPCCPYDKQRNVPGEQQVIFWDGGEGCYRCSRGHKFKSNGKLI